MYRPSRVASTVLLLLLPLTAAADPGAAPYLDKLWYQPTIREDQTSQWALKGAARELTQRGTAVLSSFTPTAVGNRVLYRSWWGVHCVNLTTGKLEWESDSRWSLDVLVRDKTRSGTLGQWFMGFQGVGRASVLLDNLVLGSVATDGKRVYAVEDLALPPFVGNLGNMPPPRADFGFLNEGVHHSRLQAFDLANGKLVWELGGVGGKGDFDDSHFLSAPLVLDGKLYVAVEKESAISLVCLDPAKGKLEWTTPLAQAREPIASDPLRRLHGVPLVHAEGVLICLTQAGLVIGVDRETHTVLWAYSARDLEPRPDPANPQVPGAVLGEEGLKTTPPLVAEGRVVFAVPGRRSIVCLKVKDGSVAWRTDADREDVALGGVARGKVLVLNRSRCKALALTNGRLAWSVETGLPSGQGFVSGTAFCLPLSVSVGTGKPEVCTIDLDRGVVIAHARSHHNIVPGNLVPHNDAVLSQTVGELAVFPQLRAKLANMDELLKKNPKDPGGLSERGQLRLDRGDLLGAVDDFKTTLSTQPPEELRRKTRVRLHDALRQLVERDFKAGEKFLGEYEELCRPEVPEKATEAERKQLESEARSRMGEFLFLKGRGREQQGRLTEAFTAYLDYAENASPDELFSPPEEPALKVSRLTWVSGRVRELLKKAKPGERKEMETEIERRWKRLQKKGSLPELRSFAETIGPSSAVGREALLAVAERLREDKAFRDAERILLSLSRDREDRDHAALAAVGLARLALDQDRLSDAVEWYRVLRDLPGMAGAHLAAKIEGDPRFLPFLQELKERETPNRKKIKVTDQLRNQGFDRFYTFEPSGEVSAYFRDHRIAVDLTLPQVRVTDRLTGKEVWAERLSVTPQPTYMVRQAERSDRGQCKVFGHVAVLTLTNLLVAIDPVERKVLWTFDLLGVDRFVPGRGEAIAFADSGLFVTSPRGTRSRIAEVGPLAGGKLFVLRRDGLTALDVLTGAVTWSRADVDTGRTLLADDELVYAMPAEGAPGPTLAFRATDGGRVKVPDSVALYRRRLRTVDGKLLLMDRSADGKSQTLRLHDLHTGEDVWKRAFPSDATLLDTEEDHLVGLVGKDGRATVIDLRTQKEVLSAALAPEHLAGGGTVYLLRDRHQFYFLCHGPRGQGPIVTPDVMPGTGLRGLPVNGTVYAFDAAGGGMTWRVEMPEQALIVEQFAELPVVIFASRATKVVNLSGERISAQVSLVRIIDKRTGKVIYDHEDPKAGGQSFVALHRATASGVIELVGSGRVIRMELEK